MLKSKREDVDGDAALCQRVDVLACKRGLGTSSCKSAVTAVWARDSLPRVREDGFCPCVGGDEDIARAVAVL